MMNKLYISLIVGSAFFIYLGLGVPYLDKFDTFDEHYWVSDPMPGRINQYWEAVRDGDWENTRINDKPGITLALLSGVGAFFENDRQYYQDYGFYRVNHPEKLSMALFVYRFPIFIFNGLAMVLIGWLIYKLTDNIWISIWTYLLMILSPVIVGISSILNPDAVLWVFSTITILGYLLYLKTEQKKFAVLTSASLGLAILSKYAATILYPFMFFLFLMHFLFNYKSMADSWHKRIIFHSWSYISILSGNFLLFILFMPAVFTDFSFFTYGALGFWGMQQVLLVIGVSLILIIVDAYLNKSQVFQKLLQLATYTIPYVPKLLFGLLATISLLVIINWTDLYTVSKTALKMPFDMGRGVAFKKTDFPKQVLLEFFPLLFTISPIALFSMLFIWVRYAVKPGKYLQLVLYSSAFMVLFIASVLFIDLLIIVRYGIMLYPLMFIMAAIGLYELSSYPIASRVNKYLVTLGLIVIVFTGLWQIKPYYLNYANLLLPQKYLVSDAWGYGGYDAAQILNAMPEAENLVVWTDQNGFCTFFKGKCIKGNRDWKKNLSQDNLPINYYVKTRRGSMLYKDIWSDLIDTSYVYPDQPVWQVNIDGRKENYVRVYRNERLLRGL